MFQSLDISEQVREQQIPHTERNQLKVFQHPDNNPEHTGGIIQSVPWASYRDKRKKYWEAICLAPLKNKAIQSASHSVKTIYCIKTQGNIKTDMNRI